MEISSVLYVSESTLNPIEAESEIAKIVSKAQIYNALIGITGRLMFTGNHFAQILEGFDTEINDLMTIIDGDRRHRDIVIINRSQITARRFPEWSMAYSGPSKYVSMFVERALAASSTPDQDFAATGLVDLISNF